MIPPRGHRAEQYPLQHKLRYSFGLSTAGSAQNTAMATLVMGTNDMDVEATSVQVNPHNPAYEEDAGAVCRQMSIIDKLRLSIRFNMTAACTDLNETASGVFTGSSLTHLRFLWRPFFWSFPEKLNAVDDDTALSVATILSFTSDDANEDSVPITTGKLPVIGSSDFTQPLSTVNQAQVIGDYNYTTDDTMENFVWDEDQFQNAIRRFTNKGALKACVGRTRWVNLSRNKPFQNFYIEKFVPKSIRRVVDRTYFGIQVHVPLSSDISQDYHSLTVPTGVAHLGCKIICNYHEWNQDHDEGMGSQV